METPSGAAQAPQDRASLARNALLFICGISSRSADFARKRMQESFGLNISEAELRAAQLQLVAESTAALMAACKGKQ
jgi:hypothetical protein